MKWSVALSAMVLSCSIDAGAQQYDNSSPKEERYFIFDPNSQKWAAFVNGRKVASGPANGGGPGLETPSGTFHIYTKKGPGYLSNQYPINPDGSRGGAQMPYAMHFTKSGHAIHGAPSLSRYNSTHGCIRVKTSAAKWLNESFMTPSTKIVVYPYSYYRTGR